MNSKAQIIIDDLLKNTGNPVSKDSLIELLTAMGISEKDCLESIGALINAKTIIEETEKDGNKEIAIKDKADFALPEPEMAEKAISGLSREAFLALNCSIDLGKVKLDDFEEWLERPKCSDIPLADLLFELIFAGLAHCSIIRKRLRKSPLELAALFPDKCTENYENIITERAQSEHPKNRELLLQYLFDRFDINDGDPLRDALQSIDRINFVPKERFCLADIDTPIRIGAAATTSAMHAYIMIIKAIEPKPGDNVLICNSKGGMLSALLAIMVGDKGKVLNIDDSEKMAELSEADINKIPEISSIASAAYQEDITRGCESQSLWNIIILNGSVPKIPFKLIQQLDAVTGRILFFYRIPDDDYETCYLVKKNERVLQRTEFGNFLYTKIYGCDGWDDIEKLDELYLRAKAEKQNAKTTVEQVEKAAPYPIARLYHLAINSAEPSEKQRMAINSYEVLIKYFAIAALAVYEACDAKDEGIDRYIAKLGRPSMGDWLNLAISAKKNISKTDVGKLIVDDLNRPWADIFVVDAFRLLEEAVFKRSFGKKKVNLGAFLRDVVEYRNKFDKHGLNSKIEQETNSKALIEAFQTIVLNSRLLNNVYLAYIEKCEVDAETGDFRLLAYKLTGTVSHKDEWLVKSIVRPKHIYLFKKYQNVLCMSPWMIYTAGDFKQPDLFVYVRSGEFSTHYNRDHFPPRKVSELVESIVAKHRPMSALAKDPNAATLAFDEVLDFCATDGEISKQEFEKLLSKALSLGLSESHAGAIDYVKERISKLHPHAIIL